MEQTTFERDLIARRAHFEAEIAKIDAQLEAIRATREAEEARWNNLDALRARVDELGKLQADAQPAGDYLNPITYIEGAAVEQGKFYTDGSDIWEAIKNGTPTSFADREYFDIVG